MLILRIVFIGTNDDSRIDRWCDELLKCVLPSGPCVRSQGFTQSINILPQTLASRHNESTAELKPTTDLSSLNWRFDDTNEKLQMTTNVTGYFYFGTTNDTIYQNVWSCDVVFLFFYMYCIKTMVLLFITTSLPSA